MKRQKENKMEKTTILLVRHGESEGNALRVFTGHRGLPLTPMGHKQAEATANYIKQNYHVDAVYSSDLPRAFQTAEHIALQFDLPVVTNAGLREIYAGQWENKPIAKLPELYPEDFSVWLNNIYYSRCTGGESVQELIARVYQCLLDLAKKHPGECIVVASHATPIRSLLWKISDSEPEAFKQINFGCNCAVSELKFENGVFQTVCANYREHLSDCETMLPSNV